MSRDAEVCRQWKEDPLCHDTGTLEGLVGMTDRTNGLQEGTIVVSEGLGEGGKTRVWIGHGTADNGCSFDASKKFLDELHVEDKEFQTYEGGYHKLHTEPGQEKVRFASDVTKWILDRSGSQPPRSKL